MKTLLSLLVLTLAFTAAHAQTVSPNPAPTIITKAPYTITKPGYYQLGADLFYAGNGAANDAIITLAASNVTLDFAGHYISGPSNNAASQIYGVYANERGNINIQNGTVAYCYTGIYLGGNGSATSLNINQRITNMLVSYCYFAGVDTNNVSDSQINNCRVSFIGGSSVTSIAVGIAFEATSASTVGKGNQGNNNVVSNVTASSGTAYGLFAYGAFVSGNTIDTVTGGGGADGIYHPAAAIGNVISTTTVGIESATKYQNNLTINVTTPFDGGTNAGGNN